jgi:hypothetical protein
VCGDSVVWKPSRRRRSRPMRWRPCSRGRLSGSATRPPGFASWCRAGVGPGRRWWTIRAWRSSPPRAPPTWAGRWGHGSRRASAARYWSWAATMR